MSVCNCSCSNVYSFMADKRRMNVALTRAKYALYIIAHLQSLRVNQPLNTFFALSVRLCQSVCLDFCLYVSVCLRLSFYLCLCLSLFSVSFCLSVCRSVSVCLCFRLFDCLSVCLSVCLSLSLSLCLCNPVLLIGDILVVLFTKQIAMQLIH